METLTWIKPLNCDRLSSDLNDLEIDSGYSKTSVTTENNSSFDDFVQDQTERPLFSRHDFWDSDFEFSKGDSFDSDSHSLESFDIDGFELRQLNVVEVAFNVVHGTDKEKTEALEILATLPPEDITLHIPWSHITNILQETVCNEHGELYKKLLGLKIFSKMLAANDSPRLVSDAFLILSECSSAQIQLVNDLLIKSPVINHDISTSPRLQTQKKGKYEAVLEVLTKSVWILTTIQRCMPNKWIRFNVKRLQEIIFSFISFLDSNYKTEENQITPLLVVSILDPKSTWTKHWLHGAAGRTQLCFALKKHKKLFKLIVETVLQGIYQKNYRPAHVDITTESNNNDLKLSGMAVELTQKIDVKNLNRIPKSVPYKQTYLPKNIQRKRQREDVTLTARGTTSIFSKELPKISVHSAPSVMHSDNKYGTEERRKDKKMADRKLVSPRDPLPNDLSEIVEEEILPGLSKEVIQQALFCHCMSMICYLVQYRAGRLLFPLQVKMRRRQLTLNDILNSMINYIQNFQSIQKQSSKVRNILFFQHVSDLLRILKSVEHDLLIARKSPYYSSRF